MDLTNEDVADILALLDSLPYDEFDLQTTRFRLTLRRTPDGWTQSAQVLAEGGAGTGIAGHDRLGAGAVVVGQARHQRSTSPMIGSTDEMTAMASAMSPPRSSAGSDCRLTKLGARMCMR